MWMVFPVIIGMTRSVFTPAEVAEFTNVSINYANRMTDGTSEVYAAPIWWDAPAMRAAGFLKSTIRDMLRYTEIFRTGGMTLCTYDDYDVPADRLPDYAGTYMAFAGLGVSVAQENGNLVVRFMDGEPLPMRAIARDHFLTISQGSEPEEVRFFRDSAGQMNAVSVGGLLTVRKWKGDRAEQGQL
ncbi:hypothetical protein NLX71_21135 [Paenibacillus sp. MZ04-78.2]|uniref:hypothetical protein n=1 Tax=Paenibacillus sp. MZ04-78.2 TaxID=2962034 RepID=UPI0020B78F25|nr:hypothetical protein [Paenibacillus sp. MZ04-78.2]MCP3775783.1 hypothetical protein [Paenibacillus sp. MZ04-78.2]